MTTLAPTLRMPETHKSKRLEALSFKRSLLAADKVISQWTGIILVRSDYVK